MLQDSFDRIHNYLRVSLTDKCNLNCFYCNPIGNGNSYLKSNVLSYENLISILEKFIDSGINKIRFTGGEPLVRKDIEKFFEQIANNQLLQTIKFGITTNGVFLDKYIQNLKLANINNINISLDSLNRTKYQEITGSDYLNKVIENIALLKSQSFAKIKINVVSARNVNDNEVFDFVEFAIKNDINLRFIEFMPFSNNSWKNAEFISSAEIMEIIESKFDYQQVDSISDNTKDFQIVGTNTIISTISPISEHFCGTCNRLRITSDGMMKLCLFSEKANSLNLKELIEVEQSLFENKVTNFLSYKKYSHPEVDKLLQLNDLEMLSIGG